MARSEVVAGVALVTALWASVASADAALEGCPPWCPAPRLPTKPSPHAKGRWYPGFAMRALSLRTSVERASHGDAGRTAGAAGIEDHALGYLNKGWISARYSDHVALGYGSGGIDGGLSGDAALGLKPPFGETHGPFLRLGMRGHFVHHERFHTSLLELPQAQLGYSLLAGRLALDIGARAGFVWVGRYGVRGAVTRRLGNSPEVGGYVGIGLRPVRLDVEVTRVETPGSAGPVDSVEALLCGAVARPIACVRSRFVRGELRGPGGPESTSGAYVGISVGFGPVEWR